MASLALLKKEVALTGFCCRSKTKLSCARHGFSGAFTLLEALVAAAVFSILVGITFTVLNTGIGSWFMGDVEAELRREIIKALTVMERELKYTAAAQTNLASGATAASLSFHLPNKDANGVVINWDESAPSINWSADVIIYELNANGEIVRRTSSGQSSVLARSVIALQFSRTPPPDPFPENILRIDITVQKTDKKGRLLSDVVQLLVKMRNK